MYRKYLEYPTVAEAELKLFEKPTFCKLWNCKHLCLCNAKILQKLYSYFSYGILQFEYDFLLQNLWFLLNFNTN